MYTGLRRWEAIRSEWLKPKLSSNSNSSSSSATNIHVDRDDLDSEEILETIFSPQGDWELRQPVPLDFMVDILMDFWESEGLYNNS